MFNVVVFPEPLGPRRPRISPLSTVIVNLSTATMPPKRFVTPASSTAAWLVFIRTT